MKTDAEVMEIVNSLLAKAEPAMQAIIQIADAFAAAALEEVLAVSTLKDDRAALDGLQQQTTETLFAVVLAGQSVTGSGILCRLRRRAIEAATKSPDEEAPKPQTT